MDRLADGSWLYAPYGGVLVVAGGERIVCHACGDALAAITGHHVRRHGLDLPAYRKRFGLNRKTSLVAPALAEVRRQEGRRRWATNNAVRDGLAVGQGMAKSGEIHAIGVAAQPAGSRRAQGRRPASRGEAAPALAVVREAQATEARQRWEERARELGFSDLNAYLSDRRGRRGFVAAAVRARRWFTDGRPAARGGSMTENEPGTREELRLLLEAAGLGPNQTRRWLDFPAALLSGLVPGEAITDPATVRGWRSPRRVIFGTAE